MKKKPPQPAPTAQKAPDPPAKEAAPPQATPAPKAAPAPTAKQDGEAAAAPDEGKDLSTIPPKAEAKAPDEKPSETPYGPARPEEPKKVTVPTDPIDWFAMRQPFLNRGVPLTGRDGDQIRTNWNFTYQNMMRFGFDSDLSIKIANFGTPIAYDFAMARDNPTRIEIFDKETEKMLPPGQKLGKVVVPIITSDSLGWMVEKTTGKKIDFRF